MTRNKRAEELLAAYADGGLAPDEAAEVEALLAASPEARAELEAIRRLLGEARGAEGGAEPDWDSMARSIQRACDQAPPSRLAWLWRPRRMIALGGLAAAATAALLFVALGREQDPVPDRATQAVTEPAPPAVTEGPATAEAEEALPALREPELEELSADELAELDGELATGDLGDEGFIADLLAPAGEAADEDGFAVFDDHPLTADELAEELPPDAIEKLDRFLAEVSAG